MLFKENTADAIMTQSTSPASSPKKTVKRNPKLVSKETHKGYPLKYEGTTITIRKGNGNANVSFLTEHKEAIQDICEAETTGLRNQLIYQLLPEHDNAVDFFWGQVVGPYEAPITVDLAEITMKELVRTIYDHKISFDVFSGMSKRGGGRIPRKISSLPTYGSDLQRLLDDIEKGLSLEGKDSASTCQRASRIFTF